MAALRDDRIGIIDEDGAVPALDHIVRAPGGDYALAGQRCGACGAVVEGARIACPGCGERHALEGILLGSTGVVHTHTVVHRSYPGVAVPFVAVVVDLDGGGSVRGTLIDVDPSGDLQALRVATVFRDSGQRDAAGRPQLSYVFVPA